MIVQETDISIVESKAHNTVPLIFSKSPAHKPWLIGIFPTTRYRYLSHRRKIEFKRDFASGAYQQNEFVRVFGEPQ